MNRNMRVIVVVLVVLGVVGGGFLFTQLQQVQRQLQRSQQDVAQLTSENESLIRQLDELQTDRKNLEERLSALRTQLSSATTELERSRSGLQELQERYNRFSEERSRLQTQVSSLTSERDQAQQRAAQVEEEKNDLKRASSRLRERIKLLDRDYQRVATELEELKAAPNSSLRVVTSTGIETPPRQNPISSEVSASMVPGALELPPVIVRREGESLNPDSASVRGRLVDVNEAHRFVVVDKGSDDGVRVGMVFEIIRGSAAIGRATVVRVRPKFSACDVIQASSTGPTQVGDLAVQTGSS